MLWSSWQQPAIADATLVDVQAAYAVGDLLRTAAYAQQVYGQDNDQTLALELWVRSLIYASYAELNQETNRAEALALTSHAIERNPYDMRLLGLHAFALQANDQALDAQRVALRVIRHDEDNITARLALALAYAKQGIFEAALRDGLRAIDIAEQSAPTWRADAYRVVAIAHRDLGQYADALIAIDRALEYHRYLLAYHFERALYAQQLGDFDMATASYYHVIAFDEENMKARYRLCEMSSHLGEHAAAIDACSHVTQGLPGWAEGWYRLGREYYLNGDWAAAQDALHHCSSLQVAQGVPIDERRFECWYLQGQAAEVLRDCDHLLPLYAEYQAMSRAANLSQTWVYPDDMPLVCVTPTPHF